MDVVYCSDVPCCHNNEMNMLQGQPYCAAGVVDLLALFRCISCRYCFSTDLTKPELLGAPGRVFTSRQVACFSLLLAALICGCSVVITCRLCANVTTDRHAAGDDPQCPASEQGCIPQSPRGYALSCTLHFGVAPLQVRISILYSCVSLTGKTTTISTNQTASCLGHVAMKC